MNQFEYDFLTGNWEGPYGAAFYTVAEGCKEAGYYSGFYPRSSEPILTDAGIRAVENFKLFNQI